jgi:hypothetical protein
MSGQGEGGRVLGVACGETTTYLGVEFRELHAGGSMLEAACKPPSPFTFTCPVRA